jgi:hypothetical protein
MDLEALVLTLFKPGGRGQEGPKNQRETKEPATNKYPKATTTPKNRQSVAQENASEKKRGSV